MQLLRSLVAVMLLITASVAHAQSPPRVESITSARAAPGVATGAQVGTLIIAHGGGPAWDAQVHEVARQVRTGGPVEVSFLIGSGAATARFQDAVSKLVAAGATQIVIVPVLVSSHSGHYEQIRYLAGAVDTLDHSLMHHLHMSGIERPSARVPMLVARAFDDAPEVARVLAERALALGQSPKDQALFLIGHGANSPEDHAAWMLNLRAVADTVKQLTGFRDVKVGLVRDDAPPPVRAEAVRAAREIIELQHALTQRDVVVVPILVAKGQVSTQKIPADLAQLPIRYTSDGVLPHPHIARWIEARVRAATSGR
jgi:sirohydrochlorin ferrochelatase